MSKKDKEESEEMKNGEDEKTEEDEKGAKKKRGRPKKEGAKESKEAVHMKKFLEKGAKGAGFEVELGGRRRMEHSPVGARTRSVDKTDTSDSSRGSKGKQNVDRIIEDSENSEAARNEAETTDADAEKVKERGKEVRGMGDERERVSGAEWMNEWRIWAEGKMESLEVSVVRLGREKREMQGEIDRLKQQIGAISEELGEMGKKVEEAEKKVKLGEREREMLKSRIEEAEKNGAEEKSECAKKTQSECEARVEYGSDESEEIWRGGSESGESGVSVEGGGEEGNHTNVTESRIIGVDKACEEIEREYLKCIPERMNEREYEWEIKERKRRKNNIVIRGQAKWGRGGIGVGEIKKIIKEKLGISLEVKRSREGREGMIIELGSVKQKIEIMKRKGGLKETGLWAEDDLTEREKRAQEWLWKIEEEEKRNGLEVKVGYMKIRVEGIWYNWDEEKGQIKEVTFRSSGDRKE